ncbi:MAG: RHS repeat-associated core domain-containing protein [Lysobacteraceae bacterium]
MRGNPVDVYSGAKRMKTVDLVPSDPLLTFSRQFNEAGATGPYGGAGQSLGMGWRHSFEWQLLSIDGGDQFAVLKPDGNLVYFEKRADGHWSPVGSVEVSMVSAGWRQGIGPIWTYTASGEPRRFVFDESGRLARVELAGSTDFVELAYGSDGLLDSVTSSSGRTSHFVHEDGRLRTLIGHDDTRIAFRYTPSGELQRVTALNSEGEVQSEKAYGYTEEPGRQRMIWFDDGASGDRTYIEHDSQGRVTRSFRTIDDGSEVEVWRYAYHSNGTREVTTPSGASESYRFEERNGAQRLTFSDSDTLCAMDRRTLVEYGADGLIARRQRPEGLVDEVVRDDLGRVGSRIWYEQSAPSTILKEERFTYHADLAVPPSIEVRDPAGRILHRVVAVDASGHIVATGDTGEAGESRLTTYLRCSDEEAHSNPSACPRQGEIKMILGPHAGLPELSYQYRTYTDESGCEADGPCHRAGDLEHIRLGDRRWMTVSRFDRAGWPAEVVDQNGTVFLMTFDELGRLVSLRYRDDAGDEHLIRGVVYRPDGQVDSLFNGAGLMVEFVYDRARRLIAQRGPSGESFELRLDAAGLPLAIEKRQAGGTLDFLLENEFDRLGRLSRQSLPYGPLAQFGYDVADRVNEVDLSNGRLDTISYDGLGFARSQVFDADGLSVTVESEHDAFGQLSRVTDPKGLETVYRRSDLGHVRELVSPDTGRTVFERSVSGRLEVEEDARGRRQEFEYDALGRLVRRQGSGEHASLFFYDEPDSETGCGRSSPLGRMTRHVEGVFEARWCYDRLGRVSRQSTRTGHVEAFVDFEYDVAGRLSQVRYPSGNVVRYGRDATGRIVSVSHAAAMDQGWAHVIEAVDYLPFGPATRLVYGNGEAQERAFDLGYRPLGVSEASGSFEFDLDKVGNVASIREASSGQERHYRYDSLGRLVRVADEGGALLTEYTYDATGNRLSRLHHGQAEDYVYASDSHRLVSVGGVQRQYDASGNIANIDRGLMFNHDARSRLEAVVSIRPRLSVHNTYNGFGQRVRKSGTDGERLFVYNLQGQLLGEYDAAGRPIQEYIWMDHLPVGVMMHSGGAYSGQLMAIYPDHLGTPRAVANQSGQVLWRWSLLGEPFGDHLPDEDVNGDGVRLTFNLRFPGQYFDQATGISYNYFRHYDATVGRYLQSDPIGLAGGISTFAYVAGSPLAYVDQYGLAITLEFHEVSNSGRFHGKIVVRPENMDKWASHPKFAESGMATFGGGPDGMFSFLGTLQGGVNRPFDVSLQSEECFQLPLMHGLSEDDVIGLLLELTEKYQQNAKPRYWFFPGVGAGYNSNSYIHRLGLSAGLDMPFPEHLGVDAPGYGKPLPAYFFSR